MPLKIKRVYDAPSPDDGWRVLVDRLWPRGLTKQAAAVDLWLRDVAPSAELRSWYGHDRARWEEFRQRYAAELAGKAALLAPLRAAAQEKPVTLLFGAADVACNNAVVLQEYLEKP